MSETQNSNPESQQDELSTGLTILSFCIPIAGAIIYFSNKETKPKSAQTACNAALAGFGLGVLLNILAQLGRGH